MLVLSRKLKEVIVIGDDIRITVVAMDKNFVRLGLEAPKEVKIYRKEIIDRNQGEERKRSHESSRIKP